MSERTRVLVVVALGCDILLIEMAGNYTTALFRFAASIMVGCYFAIRVAPVATQEEAE